MKILFVVTARGGSKGVPRKNIREIGGLPLIAYKIIAARKCKYDNRIIVSTDDDEIAKVALKYGAEVPFMRPAELATDSASSMDVMEHAINWIEENDSSKYDYICMLEPSSPFASYEDFERAFDKLIESDADTLLGMKKVEVNSVFIHSLDEQGKLSKFYDAIKGLKSVRRQDQKDEYTMNGCMYIAKWDYFTEKRQFHSLNSIPYIMDDEHSIEIDTISNYLYANWLVDNNVIDISPWS